MIHIVFLLEQRNQVYNNRFKGSDRLCMVVELSMQYCGQILKNLLMTYKTILRRIFTEFDRKVEFQNHLFVWIRFENRFF